MQFIEPILSNLLDASGLRHPLDLPLGKPRGSSARSVSASWTILTRERHDAVSDYILIDPEILGGDPVFHGTRVPVSSLFEQLESGCTRDEFLENFPSVTHGAAVAVLEGAQELALEKVSPASAGNELLAHEPDIYPSSDGRPFQCKLAINK